MGGYPLTALEVKTPAIKGAAEQFADAQQLQANDQQLQEGRNKQLMFQAAQQDQQRLQQAMIDANGDPDQLPRAMRQRGVSPQAQMQIQQHLDQHREVLNKVDENTRANMGALDKTIAQWTAGLMQLPPEQRQPAYDTGRKLLPGYVNSLNLPPSLRDTAMQQMGGLPEQVPDDTGLKFLVATHNMGATMTEAQRQQANTQSQQLTADTGRQRLQVETPGIVARNTMLQQEAALTPQQRANLKPVDTSARDANRSDKSYQYHSSALDKLQSPIDTAVSRLGRLADTINQNTPQADALVAPELLTVMAGGMGSGLRMNEAEIARIVGGRTNLETLKAKLNKWQTDPSKGLSITPAQRQQVRALMAEVQSKLFAKQQALQDARQNLVNSEDPLEHRRIYADAQRKLSAIDSGQNVSQLPKGNGRVIDKGTAQMFYQAAGGDPRKAQQMAEQSGWKVQ